MDRGGESRAALAAAAATAGFGGACGRTAAAFFGQLGAPGWAGIALASALYGLALAAAARWAMDCGAASARALFARRLGRRAAGLARGLQGLLLAGASAAMLLRAGQLGALALPLRRGGLWGAALSLAVALSGPWALPALGALALAAGTGLSAALALDPRPATVYAQAETVLSLEGSLPAATLLALLYAALTAALGAGAALRHIRGVRRAGRLGLLCGGMMAASLLSANGALLRGGRHLLGQAEPGALLAARWGKAGFWLYALTAYLGATASLAGAMAGFTGRG